MSGLQTPIDSEGIQQFLPHREPFLMVDEISEITLSSTVDLSQKLTIKDLVGTRVRGTKNVREEEWYFKGHFPSFPVYPGVLIAETMAQVSSFALYPSVLEKPENFPKEYRFFLAGLDSFRFKKPVVPGDVLQIDSEFLKTKGPVCVFRAEGRVGDQVVARGELIANMHRIGGSQ